MSSRIRRCGHCANCLRPASKLKCLVLEQKRKAQAQAEMQRGSGSSGRGRGRRAGRGRGGRGRGRGKQQSASHGELPGEGELLTDDDWEEEHSRDAGRDVTTVGSLSLKDWQTRMYSDYRHMLFTGLYRHARLQHTSNLVFLLRHCAAVRNWQRLAAVVATLMASDRAENLSDMWMFRHPGSRARLAEAMGAGWLLLQHQPGSLSYEQTRRFLKQWATYQLSPVGRDAVLLELARYSRAQGHATDAWDFLCTQQFTTAAIEGQRFALMASIRLDAWAQTMREAAQVLAAAPLPPSSPNKRRRRGPAQATVWQPWQHNAQAVSRGGRMAKELHQEAVDCCKKSLEQQPEASHVAQMLAQLQLASGDASAAMATARQAREAAPLDADAPGLLALLLVAQPAQHSHSHPQSQSQQASQQEQPGMGWTPQLVAEAAECCCQVLAADPSNHSVAAALLALHDEQAMPPAALVAGCCYYLEAQPPSWQPPLLELRAWRHLAATLTQVAADVAQQQAALQQLQEQRQALLPRSLRQLQRHQRQRDQGSRQGQQRLQRLQELNASVVLAEQQLRDALAPYQQCCAVMESRLWWREAHLLPQPAGTVAAAVEAGAASPAALLVLAAVAAFVHPLWHQRVVQEWRASSGTTALPRLLQNVMTRHTAAALGRTGWHEEAAALRAASKLCRKAAAAAAESAESSAGSFGAAALASFARQRADFWRAVRKPWKPPAGWLPIPAGITHPQLGHIAALPQQWWQCFPQYRRKQRPAPLLPPPEPPLQHLRQQQTSPAGHAQVPDASPACVPQRAAAVAAPQSSQQAEQEPRTGERQQEAQALRRAQQPGIRSILKGSQPPDQLLWSQQQSPQALVGSQPPASTIAGRRVQFQLPAGEGEEDEQQQQQQDSEPMQVDSSSQQLQALTATATAAGAAGEPRRASTGRRRLLPQPPRSLADDEGEGGAGSWRERLQRRRHSDRPQQSQKPWGAA